MQLPIDMMALFEEVTDIEAAYQAPLSVSVYIDDAAPADLVAHVRNVFASSLPSVRMTVSYLDAKFVPYPDDDIAVVVAGVSHKIGASAAAIRAAGVPVMVATTSPGALAYEAQKNGHEIPEEDIVSPYPIGEADEGLALDDVAAVALDERMGRWVVSVCREKRLAFAIAFPFMRRALANDAVKATAWQNAGIGLIPILPGADLPIMTANQAKMVLQIAAAYGHDFDLGRLKELAFVVGGAYISRTLARGLIEFVPVLGFIIRPGIAFGATTAIGNAVIEYYEGGEDATGVANVAERAVEFGSKVVGTVQAKLPALTQALGAAQQKLPALTETLGRSK